VRVVGQQSCPCSACVRLHVLRFTRPYTCRPQDLQLDLLDRDALSSKGWMYKWNCVGRMRIHVRSHAHRPHECCSPLKQCVSKIYFRQNDVTPFDLSLSAPSRCLTQEAVSTANTRNVIITRNELSCFTRVRHIFCFRSTLDNTQETIATVVGCSGRALDQRGNSYVTLLSRKKYA